MWITAYLAIGYVLGWRTPLDVRWCLLGSLAPDLIDKSLGHLGVLPAYQTVSQSLVGLTALTALVAYATSRGTAAFSVAWVLHLSADVFQLTINGRGTHALGMLFWPALHWENPLLANPPPVLPTGTVLDYVPIFGGEYVLDYVATPSFPIEVAICSYAVWLAVVRPGAIRIPGRPGAAGK